MEGMCRAGTAGAGSAEAIGAALRPSNRFGEEDARAYVAYRRMGRYDLADALAAAKASRLARPGPRLMAVTPASPPEACVIKWNDIAHRRG